MAVRPDGSQVSPTNPAQRGETIQLYITGLGQATPAIATNTAGVADQTIVSPLIVGLNNGGVPLVSAVYGPGLIGVYIVVTAGSGGHPDGPVSTHRRSLLTIRRTTPISLNHLHSDQ